MTDEEIEKALEWCQYKGFYFCDECPVEQKYKDDGFCTAVLTTRAFDYIYRLKDEIAGLTGAVEALKTDEENLTRTLEEAKEELRERTDEADGNAALAMEQKLRADKLEKEFKSVREETAKGILQELLALSYGQGCVCYDVDIKAIAEKYGVEVKE